MRKPRDAADTRERVLQLLKNYFRRTALPELRRPLQQSLIRGAAVC